MLTYADVCRCHTQYLFYEMLARVGGAVMPDSSAPSAPGTPPGGGGVTLVGGGCTAIKRGGAYVYKGGEGGMWCSQVSVC